MPTPQSPSSRVWKTWNRAIAKSQRITRLLSDEFGKEPGLDVAVGTLVVGVHLLKAQDLSPALIGRIARLAFETATFKAIVRKAYRPAPRRPV